MPIALLIALVAGCSSGPDFQRPEFQAVNAWTPKQVSPALVDPYDPLGTQRFIASTVSETWWMQLRSTKLNDWVTRALAASPTLTAANATLQQARYNLAALEGISEFPLIQAKVSAQRMGTNNANAGLAGGERVFGLLNTSLVVSHELDFAGGDQRAIEALKAQVNFQAYQLDAARQALVTQLVLTAIAQAQLTARIEQTERLIATQTQLFKLTRQRVDLGSGTQLDVLALQSQLSQTLASLPGLHNQRQLTQHLLATLAGVTPDDLGVPQFRFDDFKLPNELPLSVPSEWMRRRPDVRASEALLQAASAQHGVAIAKLYPQISLSAAIGSQALTTASLFGPGSMIWNLGGQLVQPLLNPGLRFQVKASESALQASQANYLQTVLQALRQVADTLQTIQNDVLAQQELEAARESATQSHSLVERQYALGAVSYLQWLASQQQLQNTEMGVFDLRAKRLANTVALYQAMGGASRGD